MVPRPEPAQMPSGLVPTFGQYICRGLERRSTEDRENILTRYETETGPYLNKSYYGMDESRAWIVGEAVTTVTSGNCNPTQRLICAYRRDQDVLEIFAPDTETYVWGDRPVKAEAVLDAFDPASNRWANPRMLSNLELSDLLMRTTDDARFETPVGRALLLNARVLDHRYIEPTPDVYPGGSERRVFLTPLRKSNGEAIIAGRVDVRPLLDDGTLKAGVRLRIAYEDKGFLTPQMTRRDVITAEAFADSARGMIEKVVLVTPAGETEMLFEQSTGSGVHVFTAPHDGSLAQLMVEVHLEVFEERWHLRYPLYLGEFAFSHRSNQR